MKFRYLLIPTIFVLSNCNLTDSQTDQKPDIASDFTSLPDMSEKAKDAKTAEMSVPETCQNGKLDLNEPCENLETRDNTCLNLGFSGGTVGCTDVCTLDTSNCYKCGDGKINPGEMCDGGDFGAKTCDSELGAAARGALSCDLTCTAIDSRNCVTKYVQVAAGSEDVCGLKSDGTTQCWGQELVAPMSANKYTQISVGNNFACGLKLDETIECWGDNREGQLDAPAGTFRQISAGDRNFACAIQAGGRVRCWGDYRNVSIRPPTGISDQVSVGAAFICARNADGKVECWGRELPGVVPRDVFTHLSLRGIAACGIRTDKSIKCWGEKIDSTPSDVTETLSVGGHVLDGTLFSLSAFACGIKNEGELFCWGNDTKGQSTPPDGKFIQVSAGKEFACGLKADGTIECWGDEKNGKLEVPE